MLPSLAQLGLLGRLQDKMIVLYDGYGALPLKNSIELF